ncbi:hypothetical protein NA78x_000462 [Anatilimnocola sp. NA78]|uniref:hypothetical protein n=1 Tax=Anatilimnocola sp. NA78 TaxID=3415683 RepID=UPI003CE56D37
MPPEDRNEQATYFCTSAMPLESGELLVLHPVCGDFELVEEQQRSFYVCSSRGGNAQLVSQVTSRRRGQFPLREFLVDLATDAKQMIIPSSSVYVASDFPLIISTQEINYYVESIHVTAQLNYVCLSCDPGYLSAYQTALAVNNVLGPPKSGKMLPPDAMNVSFQPGDSFVINLKAEAGQSRAVVRIDSIAASGIAFLTITIWSKDKSKLIPGTIIHRSKRWNNISELDGRLRPREFINVFAEILSVT